MSYQVAKLIARIAENLPEMSSDIMQGWIENPSDLQKALRSVLVPPQNGDGQTIRLNWRKVGQVLGMEKEFAELMEKHGEVQKGHWPIYVPKGITCRKVVDALKKAGSGFYSYYDDLDAQVSHSDRDPNRDGSYAVQVKANVEADEEFKNLSANQLKKKGHQGITLLERLLLELAYYLTTGQHLDANNWTLCAGSRNHDGGVPSVHWSPDYLGVCVYWDDPDYRYDYLRSRSVVSLPAETRESVTQQA